MRRRGRSVHRKRQSEVAGEPDAVALALPGLACGLLAVVLVLYAGTIRRAPNVVSVLPVAPARAHVASVISASLASPDSTSLAALTSAQRSEKP
jgi:hypothetical protein